MDISSFYKHMVSLTLFNKGQASKIFSRVQKGESLLVVKNNNPTAVIVSPNEYEILRKISQQCIKEYDIKSADSSSRMKELLDNLKILDEDGENDV